MKHKISMLGWLLALTLGGCSYNDIEYEEVKEGVSFKKDIVPIFETNCVSCHKENGMAFSLTSNMAYDMLKSKDLVTKENSILLEKVKAGHPRGNALNENQLKKIELWIKEGALEN